MRSVHRLNVLLPLLILFDQGKHHNESWHEIEKADGEVSWKYYLSEEPFLNFHLKLRASVAILASKDINVAQHDPDSHKKFEAIENFKLLVFDGPIRPHKDFLEISYYREGVYN